MPVRTPRHTGPGISPVSRQLIMSYELTPSGRRIILGTVVTRLRRIAVTFLAAGLLAGAWRPCAGWETTAEARMSCCVRKAACTMHKVAGGTASTTVSQSEADTCCAAAERQDASQLSVTTLAPPSSTPVLQLFTEQPRVAAAWVDWHRPPPRLASRQLPTHLLLSVFLI